MKKLLCAFIIGAVVAPGMAFAGAGGASCAEAQEIFPGSSYSGDTSLNTNFVGAFGGLPSPGPDAAYKFTSDGQPTGAVELEVIGGWNAGIVITAACGGNAGNPLAAAAGTGPTLTMDVDDDAGGALTAGTTYYLFVTGNPADNSGPSGAYAFTTPTPLPVALQSFSID